MAKIPSFTGTYPTTVNLTSYDAAASVFRGWIRDAAQYSGVPHELAAAILQQENAPEASRGRKFLQSLERTATTTAAIADEWFSDLVLDKASSGSSGIANVNRATLRDAAAYIERTYGRPVLPDEVRYRLFADADTRIPGYDARADLYYMTARLRQIIDTVTGKLCYSGPLPLAQIEKIAAMYNGRGPDAEKYGRDTINRLRNAASGVRPLYFYEKSRS